MTSTSASGNSARPHLPVLAAFVAVVAAVAVVGSLAASSSSEVYASLEQPAWAPPSWLFGPVWTVLYLTIAVSGWLFYRAVGSLGAARREFTVYGVGLALNALWTPLFFGADLMALALVEIVLLDLAVVATVVLFTRRHRPSGLLLLPYLAWTLFATALNAALVLLN